MFLAEGSSLDGLITLVQWMFVSTALPGVCGLFLSRFGGLAIFLGLLSVLAGVGLLGWMIWERSTLPSFYVAAGTPLLVGAAACLRAGLTRKKHGPPSSADNH